MKLQLIIKTAMAAALSAIALDASAMTQLADDDLSEISGRDGVSIAADLHVNVGSFVYTDTDAAGGSISFNDLKISGTFAMTLDIINNATFTTAGTGEMWTVLGVATPGAVGAAAYAANFAVTADSAAATLAGAAANGAQTSSIAAFVPAGDVVKIAIPKIAVAAGHELNMSIASIKMGNGAGGYSAASYGSFAMTNVQLQGTTVYIWAH